MILKLRHSFSLPLCIIAIFLSAILPSTYAQASEYAQIGWEDLIPEGVPYSEIIGQGEIDYEADTWKPLYDQNATKFNETLANTPVKIPGYILPLELNEDGITEFILVPYIGACVHVPPPPPNQLIFVRTQQPWPTDSMWDAVWLSGTLETELQDLGIAETGYQITADKIEVYDWFE